MSFYVYPMVAHLLSTAAILFTTQWDRVVSGRCRRILRTSTVNGDYPTIVGVDYHNGKMHIDEGSSHLLSAPKNGTVANAYTNMGATINVPIPLDAKNGSAASIQNPDVFMADGLLQWVVDNTERRDSRHMFNEPPISANQLDCKAHDLKKLKFITYSDVFNLKNKVEAHHESRASGLLCESGNLSGVIDGQALTDADDRALNVALRKVQGEIAFRKTYRKSLKGKKNNYTDHCILPPKVLAQLESTDNSSARDEAAIQVGFGAMAVAEYNKERDILEAEVLKLRAEKDKLLRQVDNGGLNEFPQKGEDEIKPVDNY